MFRWNSLIPDYNGRRQVVRFGIVRSKNNPQKVDNAYSFKNQLESAIWILLSPSSV